MINLIDGSLQDPQEKIQWTENKSSAIIVLNTNSWVEGKISIVGYKTEENNKDIMVGLGIKKGVGPKCYRILVDRSVIVVAEVILDHIPDISYYAFDQRYLVKEEEGLILTRRYYDSILEEVKVERLIIEERCVISEALTGNIWICDPPGIINFFDVNSRASIENIVELEDGRIKIDVVKQGQRWEDLYFMSGDEKYYLTEKLFDKNFEVSIDGSKYDNQGKLTSSVDPCVVGKTVYTLTSTYSKNPVDLDETPAGWTRNNVGVYTRTIPGFKTSSSGSPVCKLTISGYTGSKTATGISVRVNVYSFLLYSPTVPTQIDGEDKAYLTSSTNLGKITVVPPQNSYVWLAFPNSMVPSKITQFGVNYVSPNTAVIYNVIRSGVNLGTYILYRSLNPGNGETQEITIG